MDYGDVIVHIFYEPVRLFYDLESLWIDAEKIEYEKSDGRVVVRSEEEDQGDYEAEFFLGSLGKIHHWRDHFFIPHCFDVSLLLLKSHGG
jgi:hypothetical protein